jgi:hypothetical protein
MTPLTHAAVGTVIFQKLGKSRAGHWGWVLALPLAFASHYLLDAIPHFEDMFNIVDFRAMPVVILGIGLVGAALAMILSRWNREAARIWLVLFLWIGLGGYSFSWLRILTAALALGYLAWSAKDWSAAGYMLAGLLAVAPDLIFSGIHQMAVVHQFFHYRIDWATRIYTAFSQAPPLREWQARLLNPYFLLGYALELLVEGLIFLGAAYLFFREKFVWEDREGEPDEIREPLELSQES